MRALGRIEGKLDGIQDLAEDAKKAAQSAHRRVDKVERKQFWAMGVITSCAAFIGWAIKS